MSLAQGNNTPPRPRIEPGSPDPEADALTTRPVRSPTIIMIHRSVNTLGIVLKRSDVIRLRSDVIRPITTIFA